MPGIVFKYTQTNNDGEAKLATGNPLSQSAYLSLQVPYGYYGLGDVSNYVSSLYIGIPITGSVRAAPIATLASDCLLTSTEIEV